MNPEVKALWLEALRDGTHKQARGRLALVDRNGQVEGECCLGVLCNLAVLAGVVERRRSNTGGMYFSFGTANEFLDTLEADSVLPGSVREWAGLPSANPNAGPVKLSEANDKGEPFDEIAYLIEEHL